VDRWRDLRSTRRLQRCSRTELEARKKMAEDMLSVGVAPCDVIVRSAKVRVGERQAELPDRVYERWKRLAPRTTAAAGHLTDGAHDLRQGAEGGGLPGLQPGDHAADQAVRGDGAPVPRS